MAMATRSKVILLYKNILRESKKFTSYNYREYALRRTRDSFREHMNEENPEKIATFIMMAEENLEMLRRQVLIGQMYGEGKLVIESMSHKS